jgi:DNA-binding response OmpR family regulator
MTPRILVVEDDRNVRGLLATMLLAEGYEVDTASDGVSGLIDAAAHDYALVLLDLMMPDLGGARVLEEIRSEPRHAALPVLVVTGQVDAVPAMRARIGEDNVVTKPFAVEELLARVAALTGGPS